MSKNPFIDDPADEPVEWEVIYQEGEGQDLGQAIQRLVPEPLQKQDIPDLTGNPFLDPPPEEKKPITDVVSSDNLPASLLPPCGDASCRREGHRPGGAHYDLDPSIRMKQMIEDGRMGPQFGKLGGRNAPVKKKALDVVADWAAEAAETIREAFADGIDPSQPIGVRLNAAEKILKIEADREAIEMKKQEAEFDKMNKTEIVGSIQEMLQRLRSAGEIAAEVHEMVEGEIVSDD